MGFNETYVEQILSKYRKNTYSNITGNNPYKITDRLDLTGYRCYTIDPAGCQDADDGFSIFSENIGLPIFLAIHIADPTDLFSPDSQCFQKILENGLTHYPSGHLPDHLMSDEIVERVSLMNGHKNALSIICEIDPFTYLPINNVQIRPTIVNCQDKYRFTYETADINNSSHYSSYTEYKICTRELEECLQIAKAFRSIRHTVGKNLSELNRCHVEEVHDEFGNQTFQFRTDSPNVLRMKEMIAEFAIFANSAVAKYIHQNISSDMTGSGIFRTCDAEDLLNKCGRNLAISAKDLMKEIVDGGVSAHYKSQVSTHDLVGALSYCHFTSPIRRATDCICHFLVKSIYLNMPSPFSKSDLERMANSLNQITKNEKKIQYSDIKFRTIQGIDQLVQERGFVIILARIVGTISTGAPTTGFTFVNMILEKVDEYDISISYVRKVNDSDSDKIHPNNGYVHMMVNKVNVPCAGDFDANIFIFQ